MDTTSLGMPFYSLPVRPIFVVKFVSENLCPPMFIIFLLSLFRVKKALYLELFPAVGISRRSRTIMGQGGQQEQKGTDLHGHLIGTSPNMGISLGHFRSILEESLHFAQLYK